MKVDITLKKVLALLAVLAWIATFIQAFNCIWGFWNFPMSVTTDVYGNPIGQAFNGSVWFGSAFLTGIVAVILTILAALVEEARA